MIIGLGYKARSGKDTVGLYLSDTGKFNMTSFAFSLKEAVKVIYGWTDEHVYGNLKEVIDPFWNQTPREVMQKFGTEACRNNLRKDIWVKSLEKRVMGDPDANWVITDCRFPNEAEFVHRLGGFMIRLDRDDPDAIAEGTTTHASETAMDSFENWDGVIDNNGTLNDLFAATDEQMTACRSLLR